MRYSLEVTPIGTRTVTVVIPELLLLITVMVR